jgi:hypothetical protein
VPPPHSITHYILEADAQAHGYLHKLQHPRRICKDVEGPVFPLGGMAIGNGWTDAPTQQLVQGEIVSAGPSVRHILWPVTLWSVRMPCGVRAGLNLGIRWLLCVPHLDGWEVIGCLFALEAMKQLCDVMH